MRVLMPAATMAIRMEKPVPRMTLANRSSPICPVPNGWLALGTWYRPRLRSAAWYFHTTPPMKMNRSSNTKMMRPPIAALCRKKRLKITCHCLRGLAMSRPAEAAEVGVAVVVWSAKTDPRVEVRVQDVRDQVGDNDGDRGHHDHAEHHIWLFLVDTSNQQPAHAG